jgi:predicted flap endonuclease-1-like 5' DNA nuclease
VSFIPSTHKELTMTVEINQLRGITSELVSHLQAQGVKNSEQFLELTKTAQGRRELAKAAGVDPKLVLELANRADLVRIRGVGGAFADLLEEAGVDTVKELATRRPENLLVKLEEVNTAKQLVGRKVTLEMVQEWVNHAKELPGSIEH